MLSHAAVAAELLGDRARVDAVLENPQTAPIPAAEKVLFAFVERVNGASYQLERRHVDELLAAGWSEEAVFDAITVCALFNFYNRWCDGAGVHPMSPEQHALSGQRMAQRGYVPPES